MADQAATKYMDETYRALLYKQNSTFWVALGRSDTAWPDPDNPPEVDPGATDDFIEPIVYVKADLVTLCRYESETPDVTVNGVGYAFVADVDAYTESARFLYVRATIDPAEGLPYDDYRQKAVYINLTPQAGYEGDDWLAPDNVDDTGIYARLVNKTLKTFGEGEIRTEKSIIEIR